MSTPSGSPAKPCSRLMSLTGRATSSESPASAIAGRARPRRYPWRRRKSTRSAQSTCMRPGAGTDVTVNSVLAVATERLDGFEPVRNRSPVRLQREVGAARLQLQQGGKVFVTQAPSDEADDDLVDHGRNRQGHIELTGGFQPKFEVLA